MSRILVTGANGLVGKRLVQELKENKKDEVVGVGKNDYNLLRTSHVVRMYKECKPELVYHLANIVGGIEFNIKNKADILYKNLEINNNVIHLAFEYNVKKLMFVGSTCMYPKNINRAIKEDDLFGGPLEPTNDSYATAKIAGFYLCKSYFEQYGCDFITVCPTNIYGEWDNFSEDGHVVSSIIRKVRLAKETGKDVTLLGDGNVMRDLLYVGDVVEQMIFLMNTYNNPLKQVNLSTCNYIRVFDLAKLICQLMNYDFKKVIWNCDKIKKGMQNKITSTDYLEDLMGEKVRVDSEWIGLQRVIKWFQKNYKLEEGRYVLR